MQNKYLYIALIHYPVKNKNGEVVSTAITNLDLHDMARAAKTYGVKGYYIINPMAAQRELAERIIRHWTEGFGASYNPNRGEALSIIKIVPEFRDALSEIERETGARPKVMATAAREAEGVKEDRDSEIPPTPIYQRGASGDLTKGDRVIGFEQAREVINAGPSVIAFGTGWGLTDEFIGSCDFRLPPIRGAGGQGGRFTGSTGGGYNHLPVRSAAAIILDRLAGER